MKYDCVIIGAGAAGLIAANELSRILPHVLLLEAQERAGGRIYTFNNNFSRCTALGAEFIHGDLPLTISLLRSANIPYKAMEGEMYQLAEGNIQKKNFFDEEWQQLTDELKKLQADISFEEFLKKNFRKKSMLRSTGKSGDLWKVTMPRTSPR